MIITLTTTKIQNDYLNNISANNLTLINFAQCEKLLREHYKIQNEIIYIRKLDVIQEGMKIPKIEYDLYSKLSGKNLEKLNLSICKNTKIYFSLPISITENIDKLNTSSRYYRDICYSATSDYGTDIILEDRKLEYINGNKSICQEDCDFSEYDYTNQRANCSCKVKETSSSFAFMNIDKTKLLDSFINIEKLTNINKLKCHKGLFSLKKIISNIGCLIAIGFELFHLVSIFIFCICSKAKILKDIKDITFGIENYDLIKTEKIEKSNKNKNNDKLKLKENKKENKKENNKKNKKEKILKKNSIHKIKTLNKKKGIKEKEKKIIKSKKKEENHINVNIGNYFYNNNNLINNKIKSMNKRKINKSKTSIIGKSGSQNKLIELNSKINKQKKIEKVKNILDFIDEEKNVLSFDLAIQYDKRTYCEYYISLLKTKHLLINAFCYNGDYNSKIIKIDLFLINFIIIYSVNALFFTDDTVHQIYVDKGSFDLIYQLPHIIYSSLIPIILIKFLKLLSLSNDGIISFKQDKSKENIYKRGKKLKNKLKIKFFLYFIFSFIILLFIWYYLAIFGVVYKNSQYHLLKDTLSSFILSLIYPFGIYLLPGIFRIPALSDSKDKRKCLYNFSKAVQFI